MCARCLAEKPRHASVVGSNAAVVTCEQCCGYVYVIVRAHMRAQVMSVQTGPHACTNACAPYTSDCHAWQLFRQRTVCTRDEHMHCESTERHVMRCVRYSQFDAPTLQSRVGVDTNCSAPFSECIDTIQFWNPHAHGNDIQGRVGFQGPAGERGVEGPAGKSSHPAFV
jgi:hypothetical protein